MKQAITTRYMPATNSRGSRIKAECTSGSLTIPFDYEHSDDHCHAAAAKALADKLALGAPDGAGWFGLYIAGGAIGGRGNVYVALSGSSANARGIAHGCGIEGSDFFIVNAAKEA